MRFQLHRCSGNTPKGVHRVRLFQPLPPHPSSLPRPGLNKKQWIGSQVVVRLGQRSAFIAITRLKKFYLRFIFLLKIILLFLIIIIIFLIIFCYFFPIITSFMFLTRYLYFYLIIIYTMHCTSNFIATSTYIYTSNYLTQSAPICAIIAESVA